MIDEQNNILLLKIKDYINTYYTTKGELTFEQTNGVYIVNCDGDIRVKNSKIESLTNGLFQFGNVSGNFYCYSCGKLKSLKGAPSGVGGFYCTSCPKLKSLEGAPKKVGMDFDCNGCKNLETIKGAPEEVGGNFSCSYCKNLKSLDGAPEEIGGKLYCHGCENLKITNQDRKKYRIEN